MDRDPRSQRGPYQPVARVGNDPRPGVGAVVGATAAEFSQTRFGGPTRVQSTTFTATTTWQPILAANPRRVFWTIINRGTVDAAVDVDSGATQANGILIAAGGGFASMDVQEDGESVAWPVFGATASGSAVLRILEVIRV